jgi:hypothetical protein
LLLGTRVRKTPTSTGKTNAKKVKKRNPWSDDESKSESDLEEAEPVVIPRDSLLRRAAGIVIHFIFILLYMIIDLSIWFSSINSVNKVLNHHSKERQS